MEHTSRSNTQLWEGAGNIQMSFDALGIPYDMPLTSYLQKVGRVVVRHDPVLEEIFGKEAVDLYERMLAEAEL